MLSAVLECTGGVTVSPARALGPSENFSHFYKLKKKNMVVLFFFFLTISVSLKNAQFWL